MSKERALRDVIGSESFEILEATGVIVVPEVDFEVQTHGSIWLWRAVSDRARTTAEESFDLADWQTNPFDKNSFVTDARPGMNLADQLMADGFILKRP